MTGGTRFSALGRYSKSKIKHPPKSSLSNTKLENQEHHLGAHGDQRQPAVILRVESSIERGFEKGLKEISIYFGETVVSLLSPVLLSPGQTDHGTVERPNGRQGDIS